MLFLYERELALIIPFRKRKILLQNRESISKAGEEWGFFGGGIENDEVPTETVIRETKEELSVDVVNSKFIFSFLLHIKNEKWNKRVMHYFFIQEFDDKLVNSIRVQEGDGAEWFTEKEAISLKTLIPPEVFKKIFHFIS